MIWQGSSILCQIFFRIENDHETDREMIVRVISNRLLQP